MELLGWAEAGIHLLGKVHPPGDKVERREHPAAPWYQPKTVFATGGSCGIVHS